MSKPLVYVITFVVCILLQVAVAPAIAIGGCSPDFLLIPVLLVSLRSGAASGSVAGFALGLFEDFAGNGTVGGMALTFTVIALFAGLLGSAFDTSSPVLLAIIGLVGAFLMELVYGLANVLTGIETAGYAATILGYAVPSAVYTAIFAVLALVSIRFVMVEETLADLSKLGGGYGAGGSSRTGYL